MSDILARLLLDTKDYDSKIKKAKGSTQGFASSIGSKAAMAVGKFATGIGLAMGGVEAFNKVMQSSQTLGDSWNNTINACKSSVDVFFQSLATGNWDAFNGGLLQTISNMRAVSAMKDMLDDAKLTMGFDTKKFEREYVRLEGIIDDETKSKSDREAAFAEMEALVGRFKERVQKTAEGAANTLVAEMNAKFGQNFTIADLEKYITEVNNEFLNTETLQRLNKYKETLANFKKSGGSYVVGGVYMTTDQYKAQNAELEKMRVLQDDNDESRRNMLAQMEYATELYRKADEYLKRSLEKQNKILSLNKRSGKKVGGESKPIEGSLAAIDAEIRIAQQEYANAASDAARAAAMKTIQELENKKGLIELHARVVMPNVGSGKSGSLADLASVPDLKNINLNLNPQIKTNEEYKDSILDVVNAVGTLTGSFSQGASTAISYFANVVSGVLQASAAIAGLIPLKKMEANANAEVAVTGAAASAASTPIIGWLMAGAAVASVIAAMTNIPKFAEGGIVGGSSFFGDKLLARVNSGEMILNKKQQSRLLSMTDGGNVRVSGDVKLSGKDIFISLRNYMASSGNKL